MTVRLRGHHLLCLITYEGMGYTERFTRNLDTVVARLGRHEGIEIVDGPDDVCRALIDDPSVVDAHCHLRRVTKRDRLALAAVGGLLGRSLGAGATLVLTAATLDALRAAFKDGSVRKACINCQWEHTCTVAAGAGFSASRLQLRRPPHRRA